MFNQVVLCINPQQVVVQIMKTVSVLVPCIFLSYAISKTSLPVLHCALYEINYDHLIIVVRLAVFQIAGQPAAIFA